MKRRVKTVLLLMYVVLISSAGKAELIGGHDRQRLALIFHNTLQQHFSQTPVEINTDLFPVDSVESSEGDAFYHLFDVLVEEGALTRQTTVENISDDSLLMSRVYHYKISRYAENRSFVLGYVNVSDISVMNPLPAENDATRYQVTFHWRFIQPAEWLWAPVLSRNPRIQTLLNAIDQSQSSEAQFNWVDGRWVIENISSIYY